MKVLVTTNCATEPYTLGLRAMFPTWDVRGMVNTWGEKLLAEQPTHALRGFIEAADIIIAGEHPFPQIPTAARRFEIPYFYHWGYHPDSFHLDGGDPSPLKAGNLYSRILCAAFVMGMSAADTRKCFSRGVFQALGYLDTRGARSEFVRRFADGASFDISASLKSWEASGRFLYTCNHARIDVFLDVLRLFTAQHTEFDPVAPGAEARLAAIPDECASGIQWAIYPEIADAWGVQGGYAWRCGKNGDHETLDLEAFVTRTYQRLAEHPGLSDALIPGFDAARDVLRQVVSR